MKLSAIRHALALFTVNALASCTTPETPDAGACGVVGGFLMHGSLFLPVRALLSVAAAVGLTSVCVSPSFAFRENPDLERFEVGRSLEQTLFQSGAEALASDPQAVLYAERLRDELGDGWHVNSWNQFASAPRSVTGPGIQLAGDLSHATAPEVERIARPNPPIEPGRISSAFVGALARYRVGDVRAEASGRVEVPWDAPANERFAQLTFDGIVRFPTFGVQRFRADLHAIVTVGDTAPPQRFGYLGGSGTLPTIDIPLLLGGDQLFHLDSRYEVPLQAIRLPFLGSPTVAIRHRIGSAGVHMEAGVFTRALYGASSPTRMSISGKSRTSRWSVVLA